MELPLSLSEALTGHKSAEVRREEMGEQKKGVPSVYVHGYRQNYNTSLPLMICCRCVTGTK